MRPSAEEAFDCINGNIVPNGCFNNGTSLWTPENATQAIIDTDNLQVTKTAAADAWTRNTDIISDIGTNYRIQARYQAVDATVVRMILSGGLTRDDTADNALAGGGFKELDYTLTATQFTFAIEILIQGASGAVAVIDYVKISEV